jgi:DNA-binding transcriptional LysR family regulator
MELHRIDLNLLFVLDAILEVENLTHAAQKLGISQPTVSASLNKLRTLFGDALFVRSQGAMRPTELAQQLRDPLRDILDRIRFDLLAQAPFDSEEKAGSFTISTTDFGELEALPELMNFLAREATDITIRTILCETNELPKAMDAGEIDLAYGYFTDLNAMVFHQQVILDHDAVCLVRRDHPQIRETIALEQYEKAAHAAVHPGNRIGDMISAKLKESGIERKIALAMSHSVYLPYMVSKTDLVATLPRPTAIQAAKMYPLAILETPFPSPRMKLKQVWHRRFDKSPRLKWFRRLVARLAREEARYLVPPGPPVQDVRIRNRPSAA